MNKKINLSGVKKFSLKGLFFRLSTQEKILFAKRLSILVKAGVPLLDCLRMLRKQASSPSAAHILDHVIADVENGKFLSTSLGQFKKIFGDFAINIIHVGELSGTLQENLIYLAEELKKKQELKRKMTSALVYPVIIIGATIAISALLTIFIFPKILPIFASFKFELPLTTRILIFVSFVLIHYGIFILFGLIICVFLFFFFYKMPGVRLVVDRFILRIPIFGRLSQSYQITNMCRTMALLLKSQIVIVQATTITANTLSNKVYQKEMHAISASVTKGGKMSAHLDRFPKLFPPIVSQMVSVGESTGNLDETLLYVAELYENEIDMLTKNLSTTLEPILMIVMGAIVGFIAISIITPIYEITQHLNP